MPIVSVAEGEAQCSAIANTAKINWEEPERTLPKKLLLPAASAKERAFKHRSRSVQFGG